MIIKFSLIVATYGRYTQIHNFLESINTINYNSKLIEIIIVDQNDKLDLKPLIDQYKKYINIIHVKSSEKGLSINRNIGLKYAKGDIIAFPDDDCEYLEDTLFAVENIFKNRSDVKVLMGRIVERDGKDSIRNWPKINIDINRTNFYTKCSSVTMFFKMNEHIYFDERLGVGSFFGSCEDTDILYRHLKENFKILYDPNIKIFHPHSSKNTNSEEGLEKVYSYGLGFGAFCRKNLDSFILLLFIKAEIYHLMNTIIGILVFNKNRYLKSLTAFKSRVNGIFIFKKQNRI